MKRKKLTKIRIPLKESSSEKEREKILSTYGKCVIFIDKEPCLTCGHKTRLQRIERTDGKRRIIRECLYCLCVKHTAANRSAP